MSQQIQPESTAPFQKFQYPQITPNKLDDNSSYQMNRSKFQEFQQNQQDESSQNEFKNSADDQKVGSESTNFRSQNPSQAQENTKNSIKQKPQHQKTLKLISSGCGSKIFSDNNGNVLKCTTHTKTPENEFRHRSACSFLKNEYKILKSLVHPNIIQYQKYRTSLNIADQQFCCILMKQYSCDLFDYYIGKQRELSLIKNHFRQLIDALGYVHENGVVHNDIKPENLLLDDQQKPVIADFGCSRQQGIMEKNLLQSIQNNTFDDKFKSEYNYGDQKNYWNSRELTYAAPEIFMLLSSKDKKQFESMYNQIFLQDNNQMVDESIQSKEIILNERKSDIFSMGQVLFLSIFGFFPRQTKIPNDKCPIYIHYINKDFNSFYKFVKEKSKVNITDDDMKQICDLIMQMMAYNPHERPEPIEILQHKFFSQQSSQHTQFN